MRVILGSILLALAGTALAATSKPVTYVDLNKPGALDRVAVDNPEHYRVLADIIRTVQTRSCAEVLKAYRASHEAGVNCSSYLLRTSFPPKRHVGVSIDGVHYMGNVTVDVPAELMPAR